MNNAIAYTPLASTFSTIKEGDIVEATIEKLTPQSGVLVRTKKNHLSGVITLSSLGRATNERRAAMAKYNIGQRVMVKATRYLPAAQQWLFALPHGQPQPRSALTLTKSFIPRGMTFAIDGANLVGYVHERFPMIEPVTVLKAVKEGLEQQGYQVFIFLEGRSASWAYHKGTTLAKSDFYSFCGTNVSFVQGEADLQLLQLAQYAPETIILSNDRFRNYSDRFPAIVGSNRVRRFDLDDTAGLTLSIYGVGEKIRLQDQLEQQIEDDQEMDDLTYTDIETSTPTPVTPRAKQKYESEAELLHKISRRDPSAIAILADRYIAKGAFEHACKLDQLLLKNKKRELKEKRHAKR